MGASSFLAIIKELAPMGRSYNGRALQSAHD